MLNKDCSQKLETVPCTSFFLPHINAVIQILPLKLINCDLSKLEFKKIAIPVWSQNQHSIKHSLKPRMSDIFQIPKLTGHSFADH